jgi:hypothetical protein
MLNDYRDIILLRMCIYSFYKILKKFFQFLENIVFKRIKTISWIKYKFNTNYKS